MKYFLLLTILFITAAGYTQTKFRFLDDNNETIVGVKVKVLSGENNVLFRGISNDAGELTVSQSLDERVHIQASMPGFVSLDTFAILQPEMEFYLKSDVLDQEEVIVTAQYSNSTVENSVHRVKVIDRQKIDAMGAVNLRDVLNNELGVRVSQDNVLGSSMTLQGVSGENVKILVDGVPVVGRLNGNVDISQINLQEIDHIEIVEGPLSVNYGTNALAGVINLISKKPVFRKVSGSVLGYYESIGHYNLNGEINFGAKHWSFGLSGGRNFFDGWREHHSAFKNPVPIADSNRFMTWKPKEQLFGGFHIQWHKSDWLVRYKSNIFNEFILNRGYPRPPYQETAFDDHYNTRRIDNSINLKKKLGTFGITKHTFAYNRYDRVKNTFFIDLTTLDQNLTANASDQDTSVFDQWVFRGNVARTSDSSKFNYELGYDILLESAEGRRIIEGRQQQADMALFASSEYRPIKSLILRPGLRYSYNTTYRTPVLPSLNVKWNFLSNWNLRASYARGFRAPSIKELYFEFIDINHNIVGNDELNAESSHNFQASLNHQWKKENVILKTELSGFYNSIKDRISLASIVGTEFTYVNIGSFQSNGIRLNVGAQRKNLRFNAGTAIIGRASDFVSSEVANTFIYYPEIQTSTIYTIESSATSVALFYKYQGELPNFSVDSDGNIQQVITEDYHLMDFTITQQFWKKRFAFTVGCKNILDVTQVVSGGSGGGAHSSSGNAVSVGSGRSYFASLKIHLSKRLKSQ